jgi:hypothetical protein
LHKPQAIVGHSRSNSPDGFEPIGEAAGAGIRLRWSDPLLMRGEVLEMGRDRDLEMLQMHEDRMVASRARREECLGALRAHLRAQQEGRDLVRAVRGAGRLDVQGMSFIIPVPVIQLFLEAYDRSKQPHFAPLPMLGISTQNLINPSLRRMCFGGATPPTRDGVLVTELVSGGCAQLAGVRPGDVLVAIDGVPISEKGDVPFRGHERLDWVYLIT